MAQMKHIDSKQFSSAGFVLQINEDQFFVAQGPFQLITLEKKSFQKQLGLNRLLIKPDYWDFLTFNKNQTHALQPNASTLFNQNEFQDFIASALLENNLEHELKNITWSQNFKNDFSRQFQNMQKWISDGILEKAVPIGLTETDSKHNIRPEHFLRTLVSDSTARGWIYGYWDQQHGFLGRTPELLFQSFPVDSKTITTMALAGTWPKNPDSKNNYEDPKIWNEHQIVVKDIKTQLAHYECVRQSATEVIELKNLAHLKTHLEFQYNSAEQILDVIQELHPTAALGIYPRQTDVYKAISQLPYQNQRGHFGAPFGILGHDLSHIVVGIRGISWTQNHLKLFAGCGITKDSQLEAEYQEILVKMDAVKKMLGFSK